LHRHLIFIADKNQIRQTIGLIIILNKLGDS
jgi:hypothetical protein